jgi:hypothetical protein
VDASGSILAVLVSGRLLSEGDELFESNNGGASWRLAGHEAAGAVGGPRNGPSPPGLSEISAPVDDGALAVLGPTDSRPTVAGAPAPGPRALLLSSDLGVAEAQGGGAVYSTRDSGHIWHYVLSVTPSLSPPAAPYDDVAFATKRVGYLAGPDGVAVTTDGGAHIASVLRLRPGEQVLGLDVAGHSSAVVFTTRRLLVTADAGQHWQARREPPNLASVEPPPVDFVSPLRGFAWGCARGHDFLERTVDGGGTWQPLAIPADSGCGLGPSLCVGSARVLYDLAGPGLAAADGAGTVGPLRATLYASVDGGGSWRRVGPAPDELLACSGRTLWAAEVGNPGMGTEPYVVFRSHDGGHTFAAMVGTVAKSAPFAGIGGPYPSMTLADGDLGTLSAFGPDDAVLVTACWACQAGSNIAVSITADGGSRWSGANDVLAVGPFLSYSSQSMSFVSSRVGFVLGDWSQGPGDVLVAGDRARRRRVSGA